MGIKKDEGKRQIATLVPLGAMNAIANAAEVGLTKYERDNFRDNGGLMLSRTLNAAVRHIMARTSGEVFDRDGTNILGRPIDHLDCAIWELAASCENLRIYGAAVDDLWVPGDVSADDIVKLGQGR